MSEEIKIILSEADWDWQLGKLISAEKGYQRALELDPNCWRALVQLIWFDAAFGRINAEDLERYRAMDVPEYAQYLLENLKVRLELQVEDANDPDFLRGTLKSWDISRLKFRALRLTQRWVVFAKKAYSAQLEGLAWACYREAEKISPEVFFDGGSDVSRAESRARSHMETLQGPSNE
jgi:hypothetical protein